MTYIRSFLCKTLNLFMVLQTFLTIRISASFISQPETNSSFVDPNASRRSNVEWIEQHSFGPLSPFAQTPSPNSSRYLPEDSFHSLRSDTFDSHSMRISASASASVSPASAVFPKSPQSIHTQEQLDRLLRRDRENRNKYMTHSNSSLYGRYLFDTGDGRGYLLSEEDSNVDKDGSPYRITRNASGRIVTKYFGDGDEEELAHLRSTIIHLKQSPKKSPVSLRRADSIERRRRSHSSPDRTQQSPAVADIDYGMTLTENDWIRGEHRMRVWVVNTVLTPLTKAVAELNHLLEQERITPSLRIGSSSVDTLKLALHERPKLRSSALPFIIPYLSVHNNQAYIVQRISELASNPFMRDYKWNSGGTEPLEEKTWSGRAARRAWTDALPTDALFVFDLFSAYMDSQLNSSPIVGTSRVDQPFTSHYTLKAPQKPGAIHLSSHSFYIHMTSPQPPNFEFVSTDADGTSSRQSTPKGASNLFRVLVQFVRHAKMNNNGHLDQLSLGPSGVNLLCVLN
ncbi:hypothetical protein WR25_18084 [Diploscapter pachys]|uniref:Uncharacterized protein n=1 Tax=Diploscapter pachys TaxID=2018661 RepID=A0A2A2LKQ1_9BILA|nr:hypothetical protein WR25_18084 [Diploscapter pachys]